MTLVTKSHQLVAALLRVSHVIVTPTSPKTAMMTIHSEALNGSKGFIKLAQTPPVSAPVLKVMTWK